MSVDSNATQLYIDWYFTACMPSYFLLLFFFFFFLKVYGIYRRDKKTSEKWGWELLFACFYSEMVLDKTVAFILRYHYPTLLMFRWLWWRHSYKITCLKDSCNHQAASSVHQITRECLSILFRLAYMGHFRTCPYYALCRSFISVLCCVLHVCSVSYDLCTFMAIILFAPLIRDCRSDNMGSIAI